MRQLHPSQRLSCRYIVIKNALDPPFTDLTIFRYQQQVRAQAALQKSETTLYAFGMATRGNAFPVDLKTLRLLANPTGGYAEAISAPEAIHDVIVRLVDDLRAQYMVAFEPAAAHDGKFHRITIKPHDVHYRIRAKAGYVASPDQ
jgi:hypothetical protein